MNLATALHASGLDCEHFHLTIVEDRPRYAVAASRSGEADSLVSLALLYQPSYRNIVVLDSMQLKYDPGLCRRDLDVRAETSTTRPYTIDICISGHTFCEANIDTQSIVCEPL